MTKKQLSPSDSVSKSSAARSRPHSAKHSKAAVSPVAESSPVPESSIVETSAQVLYDHDAIALLAYSYWEARGYQGGSQEEDWLKAQEEIEKEQQLAGRL